MAWIDAGVNLLDERFDSEVLNRAFKANVTHAVVIASTIEESLTAQSFIAQNPSPVKLTQTAGVHPHYADATNCHTWSKLKRLIADKSMSAIGECGLDFNRNFSSKENQLYVFEKQLEIAAEYNLGVYLHERDAFDQQISLLQKYAPHLKFMLTHCFTGNSTQMHEYLDLGCFIGVTGWVCDPKRGEALRKSVAELPLNKLVIETDAPYLFPKTLKPRRSRNEPCNLPHIAQQISNVNGKSMLEIEESAFKNAHNLFFD